jgi:uncharacterized OsmC-like protein
MLQEKEIKVRSKVFWRGGLKTSSVVRGFEVGTDKPKSDFGTNTAPAPMEVFISGMGACLLSTFVWAVYRAHLEIEDCTVGVKATTTKTGKKGISGAAMKLTVWAGSEHRKKLDKCFDLAKNTCTLTKSVSFPLEFIMEFKDSR